jgi:Flp pilus assembly protein TadD
MVLALYGLYHQRHGDDSLAVQAFQELTHREPQNPVWWVSLAAAQARNGMLPQALESYQAAIALRPQDPAYYKLMASFCADYDFMALEKGVGAALEARLLNPQDPETRVLQARLMILTGYEATALDLLDQALTLDPENAAAAYYKGFIYFNRNEMDLARTYLTQAAIRDPNGTVGTQARNILERYFP